MRWAGGALPEIVAELFDARPLASQPVAGGDINEAYKVRLDNGTTVFVKTRSEMLPGLFEREGEGLAWLRETNTVRVPKVLAVRDEAELAHRFLVLEWIDPGPAAPDHDAGLGRDLAALHRFPCPRFGLERDNFIATLGQDNRPCPTWSEFYLLRRLEPLLHRAVDAGLLPGRCRQQLDALGSRLPDLLGADEPAARLHGDLWSGNTIVDANGRAVVIDPAVYGGHREMDLAMMKLFGGFGPEVFDAYDDAYPIAAGWEERIALHQLYPRLVHVLLFPRAGYESTVRHTLDQYG